MSETKKENWIVGLTNMEESIESAMEKREIYFSPAKGQRDEEGNLHIVFEKDAMDVYQARSDLHAISLMTREEMLEATEEFIGMNYAVWSLLKAFEKTEE